MKLGSLFDGIGGFPLSGTKYGFEPVWASEIEAFPIKVTKHHFPDMKHLGDVTKIDGAEIEPVDVITFGSPCQDLSVAGKREGLSGARSGLFMDAVRIIRGMRTATGGKYPRFAVWENVPGAFSSNKGQDFRAVLEEIGNAEIPMPKSGRWATAGMVRTETADIAWRVLDAQYHGVPQRRRRIFLVADFRGQCAGEILFIEEGLSGDIAESGEEGQEAAATAGDGVEGTIFAIAFGGAREQNVSSPLMANEGPNRHQGFSNTQFDAVCIRMREGCAGGGKGPLISEDKSLTLGCNNDQAVFAMQRFDEYKKSDISSSLKQRDYKDATDLVLEPQLYDMTHADEVMRPVEKGIAPTLNSRMGTGGNQVPVMLQRQVSAICLQGSMIGRADKNGPQGDGINEDVSFTLNTTDRHAVAFACNQRDEVRDMKDKSGALQAQPGMKQQTFVVQLNGDRDNPGVSVSDKAFCIPANPMSDRGQAVATVDCRNLCENEELSGTIQAKENGGYSLNYQNPVRVGYAVRRLTPTECLRLQGFPDWWLDIEGASDTAKYKSIGNSVAIPCVDFVMSGIARVLRREGQCE